MALQDLIFRTITKAGYTTKGSELTWTELDENFEILVDELANILTSSIGNVAPFNPAIFYDSTNPTYVSYNGNIYLYINANPTIGITPDSDPLTWQLVSAGALTHQQNTDTKLAQGTANEVNAVDLKNHLEKHSISIDRSTAIAAQFTGTLLEGYSYFIYDAVSPVMVFAITPYELSSDGVALFENADYNSATSSMLYVDVNPTFGLYSSVWGDSSSAWWTAVVAAYPSPASRIGKMCIYKNKHYASVTGNNSLNTPNLDPTNWSLVAVGDASYQRECDSVCYDINNDLFISRKDKRGNHYTMNPNALGNISEMFQFGNNNVVGNTIEGVLDISSNNGMFNNNNIVGNETSIAVLINRGRIIGNNFTTCNSISIVENSDEFKYNTFISINNATITNKGEMRNNFFYASNNLGIDNQEQIIESSFRNLRPYSNIQCPSGSQLYPVFWEYDVPTTDAGLNQYYLTPSFSSKISNVNSNSAASILDIGYDGLHNHSSTTGTMTINDIVFLGDTRLVMIKPEPFNTLTINYGTGNIYGAGVSSTLDGSLGHWVLGIASATMGGSFIVIYVNN